MINNGQYSCKISNLSLCKFVNINCNRCFSKFVVALVLLFGISVSFAQNSTNVEIIEDNALFEIQRIDETSDAEAEIGNYTLVLIRKNSADTVVVCNNLSETEAQAGKYVNGDLFYVSKLDIIKFNAPRGIHDTVFTAPTQCNPEGYIFLPDSIALIALANYSTENIMFSIVALPQWKAFWTQSVYHENLGLEYLDISFEKATPDRINVSTSQGNYLILLNERKVPEVRPY